MFRLWGLSVFCQNGQTHKFRRFKHHPILKSKLECQHTFAQTTVIDFHTKSQGQSDSRAFCGILLVLLLKTTSVHGPPASGWLRCMLLCVSSWFGRWRFTGNLLCQYSALAAQGRLNGSDRNLPYDSQPATHMSEARLRLSGSIIRRFHSPLTYSVWQGWCELHGNTLYTRGLCFEPHARHRAKLTN